MWNIIFSYRVILNLPFKDVNGIIHVHVHPEKLYLQFYNESSTNDLFSNQNVFSCLMIQGIASLSIWISGMGYLLVNDTTTFQLILSQVCFCAYNHGQNCCIYINQYPLHPHSMLRARAQNVSIYSKLHLVVGDTSVPSNCDQDCACRSLGLIAQTFYKHNTFNSGIHLLIATCRVVPYG